MSFHLQMFQTERRSACLVKKQHEGKAKPRLCRTSFRHPQLRIGWFHFCARTGTSQYEIYCSTEQSFSKGWRKRRLRGVLLWDWGRSPTPWVWGRGGCIVFRKWTSFAKTNSAGNWVPLRRGAVRVAPGQAAEPLPQAQITGWLGL